MNKITKVIFALAYPLVIITILIMATVPPVSRDAQTHHLALPKIWLSQGILSEVPDMDFSYYPQLVDLLYVIPLALDYDIAAKYIHFGFGLGCAFLIFWYIRRFLGYSWGLLGGLMFLTVPIIVKLSVTVYVDLGLLFFFTGSLFSTLIWLENPQKLRWLILSAILSGLALSSKYNALLSVLILGLLLLYFYLKTRPTKENQQLNAIKYSLVFGFFALLIYSPWLLRNYSLTGNPVYPLYQSVFSQAGVTEKKISETESLSSEQAKPLTFRRMVYHENLLSILAVPIRIFYQGEDDNPQYFDGKLNPLLLLLPLLLFLVKKVRWQNQFLAYYVLITLLYTLLAADMRIRYIITIVSPMIVLSVFGLFHLHKWLQLKNLPSIITLILPGTLIVIFFSYNLNYAVTLFKHIDPIAYQSGKISKDAYLSKYVPHYALNKLANNLVTADKKLLGIYLGNRRYYIDVAVSFESELLFKLAQQVNDANELKQALFDRNITHILARVDLFNNELSYKDSHTKNIMAQFFNSQVKLIERQEVVGLYQLLD